jgi:hypothetical protein
LESAKECVTTHQPNELALKMDDAEADHLNSAMNVNVKHSCVGGRGDHDASSCVNMAEVVSSADLGGSSKYSNENFED